jgi:hypothetical protein
MSVGRWRDGDGDDDRETPKCSQKNKPHYQFVRHKSYVDFGDTRFCIVHLCCYILMISLDMCVTMFRRKTLTPSSG